ncbi:MAG: hypothetical protein ACRCTA_05225, partial [Bacilli bacterium]
KRLAADGAQLYLSDINEEKVNQVALDLNAQVIKPQDFVGFDADVLVPCALGMVFTHQNVATIKAQLIAGAANNILEDDEVGAILFKKDILVIPDFIINAGGVINASMELEENGYNEEASLKRVSQIYDTVTNIVELSRANNKAPGIVAKEYAQSKIDEAL